MPYFPMFVDLKDQIVLIAGGGKVALRKLQKLTPFGASPTVIAPDILPELAALTGVKFYRRAFRPSDLRPRPALVIAATDDRKVNRHISELCRKRHIPVNVADDPALCSFVFPALIQEGDFSAGITTGGASPAASAYFKERLSELLPEHLAEILSWLRVIRQTLQSSIPEQTERAAVFRRLFEACMEKGAPLTEEEFKENAKTSTGSVALVGAGCGRADLITLRGLKLLRQCQAVVYDDLIDTALLNETPESAERIYMGKRGGSHAAPQSEIIQKLIELARSGLRVVRLKGGDPYLFGRGGEEMLALKNAGIPCKEVPGIPSAIGIPAEAGIPVTHRGVSRSLHIVTAHTADTPDSLPGDLDTLAKLSGTLVFLMGLKQLPRITARLMAAGRDGNTPAAVISGGNAPDPAFVRAPLSRLAEAAKNAGVTSPAVILIGDVAAMDLSAASENPDSHAECTFHAAPGTLPAAPEKPGDHLEHASHLTPGILPAAADMPGGHTEHARYATPGRLDGLRIGITGTQAVAAKQQSALKALGAEGLWVLRYNIKELPLEPAMKALEKNPHWIVFTSANGVDVFFRQAAKTRLDTASLPEYKFAVIGKATGEALAKHGLHAALCPKIFTSEALAYGLAAVARPEERILLFRSAIATSTLPGILRNAGFTVEDIPIYDLECRAFADPLPKMDYITFSSANGVRLFFERYGRIPEGTRPVCIGSVTAETLSQYTDRPFLTAEDISADGIVRTILADVPENR